MSAARLWRLPAFRWGLLLRVALIVVLVPQVQAQWFVPFMTHALDHPSFDPWTSYLAAGGTTLAFPYGPVMFLAHLPGVALGWIAARGVSDPYWIGVGFRLSLLAVDVGALMLLLRLFPDKPRLLLWLYWWSPLALYVTYWNGQTDIVPVALLLLALWMLREFRPTASGAAMGLAIAAKLSMVLALPFMVVYLWRNKRLRGMLKPFALGFVAAQAVLQLPWLASRGFVAMVFGTAESARVFDLSLPVGTHYEIYLTPTLYLLALYSVWRFRRISFELLIATTGLSFFLVVLATPAPPGWYLWLLPFLIAHQMHSDRATTVLATVFMGALIALHVFISPGVSAPMIGFDPGPEIARLAQLITPHVHSVWITAVVAMGLVLIAQMLRERVARNDYYRVAQKPLTLGIAGDSGAGKDTLGRAIAGVFGDHSVVHVSGDDYHVWDRFAPMWAGMTHLNPRANDLQRFNADVIALIDGKAVVCRRYDHTAGRFMAPTLLDRNDVIIASGLHALHSAPLRERFDVSVFLDIDEDLRRAWKVHRDVHQRGHSLDKVLAAIERRADDAALHIHPQRAHADLVLRLAPVNRRHLAHHESPRDVRLMLIARIRHSTYHERLARALIGVCGLHLDMQQSEQSSEVELRIEGDVSAEDIALAARDLAPSLTEMLDVAPLWEDGMTGIMQLLVLVQMEQSLKSRIA